MAVLGRIAIRGNTLLAQQEPPTIDAIGALRHNDLHASPGLILSTGPECVRKV